MGAGESLAALAVPSIASNIAKATIHDLFRSIIRPSFA
jgi:hypothetical protein